SRLSHHRGAQAAQRRRVRPPGRNRLSGPAPARTRWVARELVGDGSGAPPPGLQADCTRTACAGGGPAGMARLHKGGRGGGHVSYLAELSDELGAIGIRGSRRRRIIAEVADHLASGGEVESFGSPPLIAQRFADELATAETRRLAWRSFLAPAGIGFGLLFVLLRPGPDITSAQTLAVGLAAAMTMVLAPQIALASGLLALALGWRIRAETVAPAAAVRVLRRRVALAIGCGALTLTAVATYGFEYNAQLPGWWPIAAYAVAGTLLLPLGVAGIALARTARLRPQAGGMVTDVVGEISQGQPWRFCLFFATAVGLVALAGGGLDEGPRNAVAEIVLICASFAAL